MLQKYSEIEKVLQAKDAVLAKVIKSNGLKIQPHPSVDIYLDLMNSIVSQQLSVKVARVIWKRFLDLFQNLYPDPEAVLSFEISELRKVGLSNSKANYLQNVAEFSIKNNLSFESLQELSDDEIIKLLTQIKGVGKWTVQMILMFSMDRPDVFPVDDLGIQTKMKVIYQLEEEKKELKKKITEIAENWKPYRTLASKHIWNYEIPKE